MANIQHLYRGAGDPNDNPDLDLTGDAVGNHIYQDITDDLSVWISLFYEEEGHVHHEGWVRMFRETDLNLGRVDVHQPRFEGQMGFSMGEGSLFAEGSLFIAMHDPDSDYALRWRSTGMVLGDWYTP